MYLAKRQVHSVRLFKQSLSAFLARRTCTLTSEADTNLLPLNRGRWFAADIVYYAVDAFYAVDDVVGDAGQ